MIPGDIEKKIEKALLATQADKLKATVLIAPHHGSKTSSSTAFLDTVTPETVIFTMGYRNPFGHPKPEIIQRYQQINSQIYRSDWHGAIELNINQTSLKISHWRAQEKRYWMQ